MKMPEVHKVPAIDKGFGLSNSKEFNNFLLSQKQYSRLVKQFGDDTKLLVTTIQKINNAKLGGERYASTWKL